MTTPADIRWLKATANKVAAAAKRRAQAAVRPSSRTLARNIEIRKPSDGTRRLFIPHYWAVYVHDGRGAIARPRKSSIFIWYKNPKLDPRLPDGKFPKRAKLRRLTRDELARDKKLDRVIIAKSIKKSVPGNAFFDNHEGMRGAMAETRQIVLDEFDKHMQQSLRRVRRIKGSVTVRI